MIRKKTWVYVFPVCWALCILWLSIRPIESDPPFFSGIAWIDSVLAYIQPDKFLHALAYAALVILLLLAGSFHRDRALLGKYYIFVFVLALIYGALMEFAQLFFSYRSSDCSDLLANGIGILLALLIYRLLEQRWLLFVERIRTFKNFNRW